MSDLDRYCAQCGGVVQLGRRTVRRDECPHCTAELHACVNCQQYDASLTRGCREPSAVAEEMIRDVTRANLCQWFDHRVGRPSQTTQRSADQAQAAFDALFGGGPVRDADRERAEDAFAQLFKKD